MPTPILDAFIQAQEFKENKEHEITEGMRRWARDEYERQHGEPISGPEIDTVVAGMGWTLAMCEVYGIDFEELATVSEALMRVTKHRSRDLATAKMDPIGIGVAAGITTGLLLGLKFCEQRDGGTDD